MCQWLALLWVEAAELCAELVTGFLPESLKMELDKLMVKGRIASACTEAAG